MTARIVNRAALGLAATLLLAGCENNLVDPSETFSGGIVEGDTTLLRGESASLSSVAEYRFGFGVPFEAIWGQSDTAVVGLTGLPNGQVQVTAKAAGSSRVVVRVNRDFLDTIIVTVVDTGAVRWRRSVVGGAGQHGWDLAVGDSGQVATTDGAGQLLVFRASGDTLLRVPGACDDRTGPIFTLNGYWSSGTGCTGRFSLDGTKVFEAAAGDAGSRAAVAANGDVIVLARLAPDSVLALTRYNITGGLVWRDTLRTGAVVGAAVPGGVAIAGNGDIYAAWEFAPSPDSAFVSRWTSAGVHRWDVALPGPVGTTTPAIQGTRVFVTHAMGLAARDSSGAVVFDAAFTAAFPAAGASQSGSAPVIDASGNLYVQADAGLFSVTNAGAVRWAADSLGRGNAANSGPTLLQGGNQLVALCGLRACGVNPATGAVLWRGPAIAASATSYGGLIGAPDGTLFMRVDNEVVALWHRRIMAATGWPTLGGNRGRSGTAP